MMSKMNLLQTFMGCVYPGSIRTDSIESMENEGPDSRYQVTNIDQAGKAISNGELQLTDKDLIYFIPGKFPTCWRINCIRRYGCTETGNIFVFESGRGSATGEGTFAFKINRGSDLVARLKEKIGEGEGRARLSSVQTNHNTELIDTNRSQTAPSSPKQEVPNLIPCGAILPNYSLIDFSTTKALNESGQAHAANRDKSELEASRQS